MAADLATAPMTRSPSDAAGSLGPEPLKFGFVPESVIKDLLDVGKWRARAAAMDALQHCVRSCTDFKAIAPYFADFVSFVHQLVRDPNFKISMCAMRLLEHLFRTSSDLARSHVQATVDTVVHKFNDSKQMVRQTTAAVFRAMLACIGPRTVLGHLPPHTGHYSWRVREEVLNVYVLTMLTFPGVPLDWTATASIMLERMDDSKERVRWVALESLALVASRLPAARLKNVLMAAKAEPDKVAALEQRQQNTNLPQLDGEGFVEHTMNPDSVTSCAGGLLSPVVAEGGPEASASGPAAGRLPFAVPLPGSFSRQGSRGASEAHDARGAPGRNALTERFQAAVPAAPAADIKAAPRGSMARPRRQDTSMCPDARTLSVHSTSTLSGPEGLTPLHLPSSRLRMPPAGVGGDSNAVEEDTRRSRVGPLQKTVRRNADAAGSAGLEALAATPLQPSGSAALDAYGSSVRAVERRRRELVRTPQADTASLATSSGACSPTTVRGGAQPDDAHSVCSAPPALGQGDGSVFTRTHSGAGLLMRRFGPGSPDSAPGATQRRVRANDPQSSYGLSNDAAAPAHSLSAPTSDSPYPPGYESVSSPAGSTRSATYSPSKAMRLYTLKQRQADRRAVSAGTVATQQRGLSPGGARHGDRLSALTPEPMRTQSHPINAVLKTQPSTESDVSGNPRSMLATINAWHTTTNDEDSSEPSPTMKAAKSAPPFMEPQLRGGAATVQRRKLSLTDSALPLETAPRAHPLNRTPPRGQGSPSSTLDRGGNGGGASDLNLLDTVPCVKPEEDLAAALKELAVANAAKRKELDWVSQYEAINSMRRLVRHHPAVITGEIKAAIGAMLPCIAALRSSTSRNALNFFQELTASVGKHMGTPELEEIIPGLLRKAGELSTAGRDNFLAQHADAVLTQTVLSCAEVQVAKVLATMAGHSSASVRMKVAAHLDELLMKSRSGPLMKNASMMGRLFKTAAGLLEEGSIETRTYAKRILWSVSRFVPSAHLATLRTQVGSESRQRKVKEALDGIGPPEALPRMVQSYAAAVGVAEAEAYCERLGLPPPPLLQSTINRSDSLSGSLGGARSSDIDGVSVDSRSMASRSIGMGGARAPGQLASARVVQKLRSGSGGMTAQHTSPPLRGGNGGATGRLERRSSEDSEVKATLLDTVLVGKSMRMR